MKPNDNDYLYISTRLKARGQSLLSHEKLSRLVAARSGEDAVKILTENGWNAFDASDLDACEAEIARQQQEAFELVRQYCPERRIVDVFRLKYDCHNLKAAIKANSLGLDPMPLMSSAGTVSPTDLVSSAREGDFSVLPDIMRKAAVEASELLGRTNDPQLSDLLLDRALTEQMQQLSEEAESVFLLGYVRLMTDLQNLRVLVRAARAKKGYDYLKRALFTGGSVNLSGLTVETTPELLRSKFIAAYFTEPVEAAVKALGGESMAQLDLACDNALMSYLRSSALKPFGEAQVIGYLLAKETELVSVRTVMSGRKAGLSPEQITERLRMSYV